MSSSSRAGDNFTGDPVIDQYEPPGEPMLELLNRLGLDLLCPGNHEFDYGLENLRKFAARARFPIGLGQHRGAAGRPAAAAALGGAEDQRRDHASSSSA